LAGNVILVKGLVRGITLGKGKRRGSKSNCQGLPPKKWFCYISFGEAHPVQVMGAGSWKGLGPGSDGSRDTSPAK
jgi:hypothetical protein